MDIRGGCALNGLPVPCSLVNEAMASETISVAFEYQRNDGSVVPEQGRITHVGAGLITFGYPSLEFVTSSGDPIYRLGWHAGSFYQPLQDAADPQGRLDDAKADLMSRLGKNDGKNPCADLFGGYKKAIKSLKESNISFQTLRGPISATVLGDFVHAATNGKNIIINTRGGFMAVNGSVPTEISRLPNTDRRNERAFVTNAVVPGGFVQFQNDVKFASFILLHELGHRRGIYKNDNKDAINDKNGTSLEKTQRNNQKILEACFKD